MIVLALLTGLRSFNPGVLPPASPSASPSRPPSPSPTSSPSPTPTRDAFAAARARLADVRAAIDAARGSGGLKGKDANELLALANKVGEAIDDRDASEARDAAGKLVEQVRKDIKDGDIGGDRARDLLAAAEALRDAIP